MPMKQRGPGVPRGEVAPVVRFVELVLRIPGDEYKIRFHDQLTVLSGIGMIEREALADSLIGAITGEAESTVLVFLDGDSRPAQIVSSDGRARGTYLDDRTAAPPMLSTLAADPDALRTLMLLRAPDLGLHATRARPEDTPELAEARATLAGLTAELQAALSARAQLDGARTELHQVDGQLRAFEEGTARREYVGVLADLERVRVEAAALQSGASGVEADRHLLACSDEARDLADRWCEAADRVENLTAAFGARARLDEDEVARARHIPEDPPAELPKLVATWAAARTDLAQLEARLHELAAARLPDPSDPAVVDLARLDQEALWEAHRRVADVTHRLEQEQLKLGGLGMDDEADSVLEHLEAAHSEVEAAEATVRRRWVPTLAASAGFATLSLMLVGTGPVVALPSLAASISIAGVGLAGPNRRLAAARARELDALVEAGAPTYLSFHMRRVDAAIDPTARRRLDATTVELQAAMKNWNEVTRGFDVERAVALRDEVQRYAAALAGMGGAATEIEELHLELAERAKPALDDARAALVGTLMGVGATAEGVATALDAGAPDAVEDLVTGLVVQGRAARTQAELEDAESDEEKLGRELDDLLNQLGFRDGTLDGRMGALEWAVRHAGEREEARAQSRPAADIDADLARLQAQADRLRRPEWASATPSEAREPDVEALRRRREALRTGLAASPAVGDIERLADRHSAMERRVASLESQRGQRPQRVCGGPARRHPAVPARSPHEGGPRRPAGRGRARRARRAVPEGRRRAQVGTPRPTPPPRRKDPTRLPDRRPLRYSLGQKKSSSRPDHAFGARGRTRLAGEPAQPTRTQAFRPSAWPSAPWCTLGVWHAPTSTSTSTRARWSWTATGSQPNGTRSTSRCGRSRRNLWSSMKREGCAGRAGRATSTRCAPAQPCDPDRQLGMGRVPARHR